MKFQEKFVKLKNGKEVKIRQAQISDAEMILNTVKIYIPDSEFIPKYEDEILLTIEQERSWIESFLQNDNSLLLVAEHKNQIIGNIDLTGSQRKMMYHTAVIGMGMLREWRNIGLGTALMESIIDWSTNHPVLETIWLQVYAQNDLGLGLYRKMGFEKTGFIPNFFKRDGRYYDIVTMSRKVDSSM